MASLLAITEDDSTIEIGTVGREGYLGAPILHQVGITAYRVTAQMPMTALRIEARAFLSEVNRSGPLREVLLRYAHVQRARQDQAGRFVVAGDIHRAVISAALTLYSGSEA